MNLAQAIIFIFKETSNDNVCVTCVNKSHYTFNFPHSRVKWAHTIDMSK
jgi:hypothetical protein